jgi:hypothetical protein
LSQANNTFDLLLLFAHEVLRGEGNVGRKWSGEHRRFESATKGAVKDTKYKKKEKTLVEEGQSD